MNPIRAVLVLLVTGLIIVSILHFGYGYFPDKEPVWLVRIVK